MPQLDDTGTFISQVFWLIVTFCLLYFIVVRFILPRVTEVLEAREHKVSSDLEQAEDAKIESEKLMAQLEESMAQARHKAHNIIATAKAEAADIRKTQEDAFELSMKKKLATFNLNLDVARKKSLADVEDSAAKIAETLISHLSGVSVSSDLIADSIKQEKIH